MSLFSPQPVCVLNDPTEETVSIPSAREVLAPESFTSENALLFIQD